MNLKKEIMTPPELGAGRRGRRPLHQDNSKLINVNLILFGKYPPDYGW